MLVSAVLHQNVRYDEAKEQADVVTQLYLFGDAQWVDIDPARDFREYAGPVGIHQADTVGSTRIKSFPPKSLHSTTDGASAVIEFVDTWSVDSEWLYVLSLPSRAAARTLRIADSEGKIVPSVVGAGADGRLCHYLYTLRRTALLVQARLEFNELLYKSVRESIGRLPTEEQRDAVGGARTAYWNLHRALLETVEDPPGIRWAVKSTARLSRDLGTVTGDGDHR